MRWSWSRTAAAVALLAGASGAGAQVQWTGPGSNGHFYQVVAAPPAGISWTAADAAATAAGGYLATILSGGENDFVASLAGDYATYWFTDTFGNSEGPWLGGFQPVGSAEPLGGWQWVHGDGAFGYANWAPGEPNDFGAGEGNLALFRPGAPASGSQWNDVGDATPIRGYVVEFDASPSAVPEPATVVLLGAGLAALGGVARRTRRGG